MPEQIALTGQLEVQKLDAEHFVLTLDAGAGRLYTITLDAEMAKAVGAALVAPSVALPGNGHPG